MAGWLNTAPASAAALTTAFLASPTARPTRRSCASIRRSATETSRSRPAPTSTGWRPTRPGDYIYLLAPPERAQALDRFFVDLPPPPRPDPLLLGDFFVTGDHTLGELADVYGLSIAVEETAMTLAEFIASRTVRTPKAGDIVPLGAIALVVQRVTDGRVTTIGLRLAEDLEPEAPPAAKIERFKRAMRRLLSRLN